MRTYSLSRLTDHELLHALDSAVAQDCGSTAWLLAHIAEFDLRRLYLPQGYPSMYAYCVQKLHMSEDVACKRIRAARAALEFPAIFELVADGRLHLAGVVLLAPYLTKENAADMLGAAAQRTKAEIEELIARRFPRTEEMGLVMALPDLSAPGRIPVGHDGSEPTTTFTVESAPGRINVRSKIAPVAHERFSLQLTVGRGTQEKLEHARNLLGHQLPAGDLAQVVDLALDALIEKLERRKFAKTTRPRRSTRPSKSPRHIPAEVRRAVWKRDGGQCTFVSESGHRCAARKFIEFDHIQELARGGRASVTGIRLRCRAHNQYGAERAFGAGFMQHKREGAQRVAADRRHEKEARAAEEAQRAAEARAADEARRAAEAKVRAAVDEVITPLRVLGFRAEEARQAAALCESIPDASLEQRVRLALSYFRRPGRSPAQAMSG